MSDTPKTDELAKREFVTDGVWIRHARELERENAELRAHAERVGEANDRLVVENAALRKAKEMVELERCEMMRSMSLAQNQSQQLRADKERLDWLTNTNCWLTFPGLSKNQNWKHGTARDVIDLARKEAQT